MNLVLKPLFQLSWHNAVDSYNQCMVDGSWNNMYCCWHWLWIIL